MCKQDVKYYEFIDGLTEVALKSALKALIKKDRLIITSLIDALAEDNHNVVKTQVDIEFVAEEIFSSIKGIDPYECWVISGSKKLGKNKGTLNEAVASITFDEVMNKHNVQMEDYYKEGRSDLEIQYLKALLKGIDHYLLNHKSVLYSLIEHSAMEFLAIAETDWKFRHWKEEEECRQSFYDYVKKYHVNWESFFDDVEFEEGED